MADVDTSFIDLSTDHDLFMPTQGQIQRNRLECLDGEATDVQKYSDEGEGALPYLQYGVQTPRYCPDTSVGNFEDSGSSLFSCQHYGGSLQSFREYVGTPPLAQGEGTTVPSFPEISFIPGLAPTVPAVSPKPEISFVHEPIQKYRFRYLSEEGSHGHLAASNSTANRHSAPTIEVRNIPGDVELRLALYTAQGQCLHKLLRLHQVTEGRGAQRGRRTLNDLKEEMKFVKLAQDGPLVELRGLGIIKLTKDDLQESGKTLDEAQRIHREFNRLDTCLGVTAYVGERKVAGPVFSSKITNLRCASQLKITRRSVLTTSAEGGQEMWLLTDKVKKGDIEVRITDGEGWDDKCTGLEIFHQFIIICRTPAYPGNLEASGRTMHLYLYRKSDQESSDSYDIKYAPGRVAGESSTQVPNAKKRKIVDKDADFELLMPHLEQMRALHQNDMAGETQPLFVPQILALPQEFSRSPTTPPTCQDSPPGHPSQLRSPASQTVASQPHFRTTLQASHLTPVTSSYSLDVNWASTQPNLQVNSPNGAPSTMQPSPHFPYGPQDPKPFHVTNQSPTTYAGHASPRTSLHDIQSSARFNGAPTRQENRLAHNPNATEAFAPSASPFRQGHGRLQETNATEGIATASMLSFFDFASDFDLEAPCPQGRVGASPSWSLVTDSAGSSHHRNTKKNTKESKYDWEEEEKEGEKNKIEGVTTKRWKQTVVKEEKEEPAKERRGKNEENRKSPFESGDGRECKNRKFIDVNARDRYGDTLLHYAVRKGDSLAVAWLVSQGADVNQQAQLSGDTPLHLAVKYDMRVVLRVLLDLENLDLHVKNDAGQTFLDVLQPDSSVLQDVLGHARTRKMSLQVCFSDASLEDTPVPGGHLEQQRGDISHTKSTSQTDSLNEPRDEARGEEKNEKEGEEGESRERRKETPQINLWYYMFLPIFLAYCYSVVSYWSKEDLG
ncbi:uncharacterized protein LOC134766204 [Penaeus indicus]|uniref:uncharacterized protein LOC134766204 n=1 Tax=Penaeus indicus TaxID=29960 RepID=UPI00300D820A